MSKDIFDQLKELSKKYTLIYGWGEFEEHDGVIVLIDFEETSFIVKAGNCNEEMIVELMGVHTHAVKDEGFYEFYALLQYSPPQIGDYPPPNVECEEYYDILHIEYTKTNQ